MVLSVGHQCSGTLPAGVCWLPLSAATAHVCSEKLTRTLTSPVFVELPHQLLPSHIPGRERHPGGSPWFTPFSESAGRGQSLEMHFSHHVIYLHGTCLVRV